MKLIYPAIFTPYEDGSGGYMVEFPDLPECITNGDTMAEAIFMLEDAASGWVLTELGDGREAPEASELSEIPMQPGQFVNMVVLGMDSYTVKYGNRSVKKTPTTPAWLNTSVEEDHISCSAVLRQALSERMQSTGEDSVVRK